MSYVEAVLALLKLVNLLVEYGQQRRWFNAGVDAEIARQAVRVAQKTDYAKQLAERVDALPDQDVDDLLARMERDSVQPHAKA